MNIWTFQKRHTIVTFRVSKMDFNSFKIHLITYNLYYFTLRIFYTASQTEQFPRTILM